MKKNSQKRPPGCLKMETLLLLLEMTPRLCSSVSKNLNNTKTRLFNHEGLDEDKKVNYTFAITVNFAGTL